jgi:hypothetical protein
VLQESTNEEGETIEEEVPIGKLKVKQYEPIRKNIILVPVNDAVAPNPSLLQDKLNKIYAPAVAAWDVKSAEPFEVSEEDLKTLDEGESGMFASFPQNMRQFNRDYKRSVENFDKDAYYLFVIEGDYSNKAGIMPFKRQFGYIFKNNVDNINKTIAHELAHGAFRLRHTFSEEGFIANKNSTDNLMDYRPDGTDLYKHQWDLVHDPESMIGWLEDDEEGEMRMYCEQYISDLLNDINEKNSENSGLINSVWSGQMVDCEVMFDFELQNSNITLTDLYFETTLTEDVDIDFYSDVYKKTKLSVYDGIENEYVRYDFGDFDVDKEAIPIYSFIILEEDMNLFHSYLFGNERTELSKAELDSMAEDSNDALACAVGIAGTGPGCNIATREYVYFQKDDAVLFPKKECGLAGHCTKEGLKVLDGKISCLGRADKIYDDITDGLLSAFFTEVKKNDKTYKEFLSDIQTEANYGEIIIGVIHSDDRPYGAGHIIVIIPSALYSEEIDKKSIFEGTPKAENGITPPIALEAGGQNKKIKPMWELERVDKYEWYVYKN